MNKQIFYSLLILEKYWFHIKLHQDIINEEMFPYFAVILVIGDVIAACKAVKEREHPFRDYFVPGKI